MNSAHSSKRTGAKSSESQQDWTHTTRNLGFVLLGVSMAIWLPLIATILFICSIASRATRWISSSSKSKRHNAFFNAQCVLEGEDE